MADRGGGGRAPRLRRRGRRPPPAGADQAARARSSLLGAVAVPRDPASSEIEAIRRALLLFASHQRPLRPLAGPTRRGARDLPVDRGAAPPAPVPGLFGDLALRAPGL